MRSFRRLAARSERRGLRKTFFSLIFRARAAVRSLRLPAPDFAAAREAAGKGRTRQTLERAFLALRFRFEPEAYYRLGLYDSERFRRAGEFVPFRQFVAVQQHLLRQVSTDEQDRVWDKQKLYALLEGRDLPCPRRIATWDPAAGRLQGDVEALSASEVFFKPVRAMCGRGAGTLVPESADRWTLDSGQDGPLSVDWAGVEAFFERCGEEMLLSERLRNHPDMARLGTHALHTVRLVTARRDGDVRPELAALRIAGAGGCVDNFASGGVAAAIDLATGRVGCGALKRTDSQPGSLSRMPGAPQSFRGLVLPHWQGVLDLGCRVHRLFAGPPMMGHDIGITPAGPVVVETNLCWDGDVFQKGADRGLGRTFFVPFVLECAGRRRSLG